MRKTKVLCVCFLLLTALPATGSASPDRVWEGQPEYTRLDEITGKNIGVVTGFEG